MGDGVKKEKNYTVKINIGDKCYWMGKEDIIIYECDSYLKKRNHYRYKSKNMKMSGWFACYNRQQLGGCLSRYL